MNNYLLDGIFMNDKYEIEDAEYKQDEIVSWIIILCCLEKYF